MKQSKFVAGAIIGGFFGVRLAPKLKQSFQDLASSIENIDIEETKKMYQTRYEKFIKKVKKMKKKEVTKYIQNQSFFFNEQCDSLIKDIPFMEQKITTIKEHVTNFSKDLLKQIEK